REGIRGKSRRMSARPCLGGASFVPGSVSRIRTSIRGAEHGQSRFGTAETGLTIADPRNEECGIQDWGRVGPVSAVAEECLHGETKRYLVKCSRRDAGADKRVVGRMVATDGATDATEEACQWSALAVRPGA